MKEWTAFMKHYSSYLQANKCRPIRWVKTAVYLQGIVLIHHWRSEICLWETSVPCIVQSQLPWRKNLWSELTVASVTSKRLLMASSIWLRVISVLEIWPTNNWKLVENLLTKVDWLCEMNAGSSYHFHLTLDFTSLNELAICNQH